MNIPEKFHNSLTDQPFQTCKICERDFMEHQLDYVIEKAYRKFPGDMGEELLFEMAICLDCAGKMRKQLSEESKEAVQKFFMERARARQKENLSREDLMHQCLLSGDPLEDLEEYQIYAHCRGDRISPYGGTYLLGGPILEQMQALLSKKTRDELERFSEENLGGPPELRKLFSGSDLVSF